MSAQLTFLNINLSFGNLELLGQVFCQVAVGFAVNRRRGNGDFQLFTVQADDLIPAGFGLNIQPQNQIITITFYRIVSYDIV
jgi:hypothetical protein